MTKTRVLTLIFFITLISLSACRKKPEKIGNDLQPNNSLIFVAFNDSQDIVTSTFTVPYLSTKNLNYAYIGNMNDPVFGNSNFDFYTQFSLESSSLHWSDDGGEAFADSIVMYLTYNGYYGDTIDKPLTIKVFEIDDEMYADSTYRSNMELNCFSEELANYTFVPRPLTPPDTILDRGVLRLPLDISIANKLIANGNYNSNDIFKEKFKGLHVLCEKNNVPASVVSFDLKHSRSYLRIYYHNDTDTLTYDFIVTSSDVRFNHYTHDYSNSEITLNDTTNNAKLYVQGTAGTRVWVKFPNLQEWASSLNNNIAINDAVLYMNGAVTDTAMYAPPAGLMAAGAKFDTDTTYVLLPDYLTGLGTEYFGGSYDADNGQVWFRITEYIQNVIKNGSYATKCDGLLIYVDQGSSTPHRWAFHGPQSDSLDKKIRLEIVYSLIND